MVDRQTIMMVIKLAIQSIPPHKPGEPIESIDFSNRKSIMIALQNAERNQSLKDYLCTLDINTLEHLVTIACVGDPCKEAHEYSNYSEYHLVHGKSDSFRCDSTRCTEYLVDRSYDLPMSYKAALSHFLCREIIV